LNNDDRRRELNRHFFSEKEHNIDTVCQPPFDANELLKTKLTSPDLTLPNPTQISYPNPVGAQIFLRFHHIKHGKSGPKESESELGMGWWKGDQKMFQYFVTSFMDDHQVDHCRTFTYFRQRQRKKIYFDRGSSLV
jgi:hypothetical protein